MFLTGEIKVNMRAHTVKNETVLYSPKVLGVLAVARLQRGAEVKAVPSSYQEEVVQDSWRGLPGAN